MTPIATPPARDPRRPAVSPLARRFRDARRDSSLAVLEGIHALKHALRFGADVVEAISADVPALADLARDLAPDQTSRLVALVEPVSPQILATAAPQSPRSDVVAIARRPVADVKALVADARPAPVVVLEDARNLGNIGACVRVAAAADAGGLLCLAGNDPWSADAIRGAAGLQFALPVARVAGLPDGDRPLVACDPRGAPLDPRELPPRAMLAFGTERHGLSDALLDRADATISIPMRAGVSSLNLATTVAAVLFAWQLSGAPAR
jgi:TrmH family RNA methyltransferase